MQGLGGRQSDSKSASSLALNDAKVVLTNTVNEETAIKPPHSPRKDLTLSVYLYRKGLGTRCDFGGQLPVVSVAMCLQKSY